MTAGPSPASSSNPSTNSPMILKTRHVSVSLKAALSAGPESSRSSWVLRRADLLSSTAAIYPFTGPHTRKRERKLSAPV